MSKPEWKKKVLRLKKDHTWQSRAGYQIFVADRGAVRFDVPKKWFIKPGQNGSIKFHDAEPPDDDVVFEMTIMYLNPRIDWEKLDLAQMVEDLVRKGSKDSIEVRPVQDNPKPGMDLAWADTLSLDKEANREVITRTCLARAKDIQVIITYAFWADLAPKMNAAWAEITRTMRLGVYIKDPTRGAQY